MGKKQTKFTTLLSTLANGATSESRRLLIDKTGSDAKNTKDLADRLAKLYATSDDKIEIEKLFATIHPHKDFILKYSVPKKFEEKTTTTIAIPVDLDKQQSQTAHEKQVHEMASFPQCKCHECNMRILSSGIDGSSSNTISGAHQDKSHVYLIAGSIAIVAILGLVLIHKHKHA